jgi:hypothetical protein
MKLNIGVVFAAFLLMKCLPLPSVPWATPVLDNNPNDALIVVDDQGNILEVSQKKEEMNTVIQAQVYHQNSNTWSSSIDLSGLEMDAHHLKIATDPEGNAVAMWQLTDGVYECIQAAFYNASKNAWTPAKNLTELEKDLQITHLAMNAQGDAFAAWKESNNRSKTATFSQKSKTWKTADSPNLSPTIPRNACFFYDAKNNQILMSEK